MRGLVAGLVAWGLMLTGCQKAGEADSKVQIQAAIESHLQQRPNVMLANMTLEIQQVKLTGDAAEAEVQFRSKQQADLVVGVHYKLKKVGDRWQVESSSPSSGMGMSPHGGPGGTTPPPRNVPLQSSH